MKQIFCAFSLTAALLASSSHIIPALATSLPSSAAEASAGTADPGRVSEQFEEESVAPGLEPAIDIEEFRSQGAPEGAENIQLTLKDITIQGVSVYTSQEVRALYAEKVGQSITLADIYTIAARLTRKYRNDGYVLSQVVVPPQTIEGGNVRMRVVEGTVASIEVEGEEDTKANDLVRRYAARIRREGAPLNVEHLERQLLLINDLPGVSARSVLSPSTTQTGAADLRIIVERDPFDALISADNYGSRYLGPMQFTAAGSLNNPFFDANERITAQAVYAPDEDVGAELAYLSLSYNQPVGAHGTSVEVFGSYTDTDPGFNLEQFDVNGQSQFLSLKVEHPLIRSRAQNFYVRGILDWRDVETSNNLEPTRKDRIAALRAGMRYDFLDTFLGVGINSIDLEMAQGLNIFGASDENDANLSRAQGDPTFFKMNAELQRLQRITNDINLLVAARGQWASTELLSSEEFGVGGTNIGRAYDPSEIIGDDGIAGKLELQWNQPLNWSLVQDYQVFGFYDAGRVWNDDASSQDLEKETATSAGLGLRTEFGAQTDANIMIAFPLNRDVETQGDDDPRVYFRLSKRF